MFSRALEWTWSMDSAGQVGSREGLDEPGLIAASLDGDNDAFSQLIQLHQHRVFRLVGRFFRRREDVEDLAQETFLTAWRKLDTYKARAPFEHWLTRVCLNCCYGRLRQNRAQELPLEPEIQRAAPGDNPDARLDMERVLAPLAPQDRFILLLIHGEGWSVAEVADRLGWTRVNVKVRAHRARRKLQQLLERS